jgi:hypothetical protein
MIIKNTIDNCTFLVVVFLLHFLTFSFKKIEKDKIIIANI